MGPNWSCVVVLRRPSIEARRSEIFVRIGRRSYIRGLLSCELGDPVLLRSGISPPALLESLVNMSSPRTSDANGGSHLHHVCCAGTRGRAKELAPGRSRNRTGGKHYEGYHREGVLGILKEVREGVGVVVIS